MVNRQRNNRKTSKRKRGRGGAWLSWLSSGKKKERTAKHTGKLTRSDAIQNLTPVASAANMITAANPRKNGCEPGNLDCSIEAAAFAAAKKDAEAVAEAKQTMSPENLKRSINFYYTFVIGEAPPSNSDMADMLLLYRNKTPIKVLYELNNTHAKNWKTIIDPTDDNSEHYIDMVAKTFKITVTSENTLIDQLNELDLLERKKKVRNVSENAAAAARQTKAVIEAKATVKPSVVAEEEPPPAEARQPAEAPPAEARQPAEAKQPGGGGRKKRRSKRKSNKKLKKRSRRRNRRKR